MVINLMYGYVLEADSGLVKIGISNNVGRRVGQHQASVGSRLTLRLTFSLGGEDRAREWERVVLQEFDELRVGRSEWLRPDEVLTAKIEAGILGGEPSVDLIKFNRELFRMVYPHTKGRPFIYKDRSGKRGWCCIVFHPTAPLAWIHWDFDSWEHAMSIMPHLQYGEPYDVYGDYRYPENWAEMLEDR